MPRIIFLLSLLTLLLSSCGSSRSVNSFYRENKRREGVQNATIPGWLIYIGTGLAHDMVRDEKARVALQFGSKIKRLRFMSTEEASPIPQADVDAFIQGIRLDGFEDLILVRDKESTVSFMVRGKKDKLRDIVVLVHSDSEMVFVNMRTSIRMQDISRLVSHFMKKEGWSEGDKKPKKHKKAQDPVAQAPEQV